jgi:hypothetical protein
LTKNFNRKTTAVFYDNKLKLSFFSKIPVTLTPQFLQTNGIWGRCFLTVEVLKETDP